LHEGHQYAALRPAISICVLTQALFPASSALHLDFRLRESSSDLILTDDLQIHLLQLNNLRVTAEKVYHALPAERWAYFLPNADKLTSAEVCRLFLDDAIAEAAGVLEMISQTPKHPNTRTTDAVQRPAEIPTRRRGAITVCDSGRRSARSSGRRRNRRSARSNAGRIPLLQELHGIGLSPVEAFAGYNEAQLNDMADQLW
jgi:PD-(D/E)XK nuclease family transposase